MAREKLRSRLKPGPASKEQSARFIRTARELECDEDPEAFKRAVRKLAKAPARRERPAKKG